MKMHFRSSESLPQPVAIIVNWWPLSVNIWTTVSQKLLKCFDYIWCVTSAGGWKHTFSFPFLWPGSKAMKVNWAYLQLHFCTIYSYCKSETYIKSVLVYLLWLHSLIHNWTSVYNRMNLLRYQNKETILRPFRLSELITFHFLSIVFHKIRYMVL